MKRGTLANIKRIFDTTKNRIYLVEVKGEKRGLLYGGLCLDTAFVTMAKYLKAGTPFLLCIDIPSSMNSWDIKDYYQYQYDIEQDRKNFITY